MVSPGRVVEEFGPKLLSQERVSVLGSSVQWGERLTNEQWKDLSLMIHKFRDIFHEKLGRARGIVHEIHTPKGTVVHEQWRPVPHHMYQIAHSSGNM